jgi:hypothetical protein
VEDLRQPAAQSRRAALVALLLMGWTVLAPAWWWTLATLGVLLVPPLIASLVDVLHKPSEVPLGQHLAFTSRNAARHGLQVLLSIAWLPHEASTARARSCALTGGSSRGGACSSGRPRASSIAAIPIPSRRLFRSMWAAPAIAAAAAAYLQSAQPLALVVAAPVLLLWLVSPALAWRVSRPRAPRVFRLAAEQTVFLRKVARRTWAYFERFVGPADHWLPPDNFQEAPAAMVAHRTSPTNMGLALLADLAAYDFGYLTAGRLIERTGKSLQTMESLERHDGHFYNWYDTQSLQPLAPALRFDGRQRKPRRSSADAAHGVHGSSRRPDRRSASVRRHDRHRAPADRLARAPRSADGRRASPPPRLRL